MDTVLIVDDSEMLLSYLESSFIKYEDQFKTVYAQDGIQAIEIIKKGNISLLVTDLQMPKVDGLGLLAYTHKYHPNIPCIIMSAHGSPTLIDDLQSDILQFIEKPFTADALANVIINALKEPPPEGSLSGISIVSFLQMIEMEQKTCLCEIQSSGNPSGFFYFNGGELHHAVYGSLKGEEAAMKLIHVENPTINFKTVPKRKIQRKINRELTGLILEAMKNKDDEQ